MMCIKRNTVHKTKRDEVIWYFWRESMKKPENWSEQNNDKPQTCYECNHEMATKTCWINPCSYEYVLEKSVRNVYCYDCYVSWTTESQDV